MEYFSFIRELLAIWHWIEKRNHYISFKHIMHEDIDLWARPPPCPLKKKRTFYHNKPYFSFLFTQFKNMSWYFILLLICWCYCCWIESACSFMLIKIHQPNKKPFSKNLSWHIYLSFMNKFFRTFVSHKYYKKWICWSSHGHYMCWRACVYFYLE